MNGERASLSSLRMRLHPYPATTWIVETTLGVWPEHEKFLTLRFSNANERHMEICERLALLVRNLTGRDLVTYCSDYRWMCENFNREQLYFARTGNYRNSDFSVVEAEIYSNPAYMSRYVRGILLSQLLWPNHARAFQDFVENFLPAIPPNSRYLEVGPGHGLYLYVASEEPNISSLTAWDISQSSIAQTNQSLAALGCNRAVSLEERDVTRPQNLDRVFDAIVISEVLEHLPDPQQTMSMLSSLLSDSGILFVNVPINSPAPDHIFLWRTEAELIELFLETGLRPIRSSCLPAGNYDLATAYAKTTAVSCVFHLQHERAASKSDC